MEQEETEKDEASHVTGRSRLRFDWTPTFNLLTNTLTQVVPDVHFSAQRSDFDDALAQEIVRFPLQTLLHF